MIHSFKVENFNSIGEEQELDFTSSKEYSDSYSKYEDTFISNVNCIVGANASGKTNLFKALFFSLFFIEKSFYSDRVTVSDFEPHILKKDKPIKIELIFSNNNNLYNYKLSLLNENVIEETLYIKKEKRFVYLYKLKNENNSIKIKYNRYNVFKRINAEEEMRFKSNKNVTFLSFLIRAGYSKKFGLSSITNKIYSNISIVDSMSYDHFFESISLSNALEKYESKELLLSYIRNFDFGIDDYIVDDKFIVKMPMGGNQKLASFKHVKGDKSFILSALDESAGTIKGTFVLLKLLMVLENGGIAIIDELDARLHYDIAKKLISLFANKDTNPHNAQLIFSTHQPLFLNDRDKAQIFLCYKEDCINSEVYRLDSVEGVRNTENFFEKYLAGEYGAKPRIGKC